MAADEVAVIAAAMDEAEQLWTPPGAPQGRT